jgi:hypothetical protein
LSDTHTIICIIPKNPLTQLPGSNHLAID